MSVHLETFDPSSYLDSDESCQNYIDVAASTGDSAFICESLGVVAKAKGMKVSDLASKLAWSESELEALFNSGGNPNLTELVKLTGALNVVLKIGINPEAESQL